jgi:hypothetical protein
MKEMVKYIKVAGFYRKRLSATLALRPETKSCCWSNDIHSYSCSDSMNDVHASIAEQNLLHKIYPRYALSWKMLVAKLS